MALALALERATPRRTSMGRQRIAMARIENESNLQVTFSKRRSGLFKKASEIATLCGVEVVIIVFSPGHKVFSFGHPSVEEITNRFLNRTPPPSSPTDPLMEAHRNACARDLNIKLANIQAMLEVERQRATALDHAMALSRSRRKCQWKAPLQELNLDELMELEGAMEGLKANVEKQIEKLTQEHQQNPSTFPQGLSSFGAGGSSSLGGGRGTDVFSFPPSTTPSSFGEGGICVSQFLKGSRLFRGGGGTGGALSFPTGPNSFRAGGSSGGALSFPTGPNSFRAGGSSGGALSFPTGPNSFGAGGSSGGALSFSAGPNFSRGGGGTPTFSTVPSSFGGGDALTFSMGKDFSGGGGSGVLPFSRGSSSFGGGGALPLSAWSGTSVGGSGSISGTLPFPGDGNVFPVPPGPSSFGQGGALSFPSRPSSFGSGSGSGGGAFPFSQQTSSRGRGGDGAGTGGGFY
ncbi:hypothetical protein RHMOL_Rhmol11G0225300 [Rhododendron molle]|uniref:Uncharacterized protein n=1 Tax=Rhododendron molle TaxID=49168 RepID=A0ACC0LVD5_RHOML|nr:hypothetical protein RHMOL_Rhmol11G0225300 [Rhododendron molle]